MDTQLDLEGQTTFTYLYHKLLSVPETLTDDEFKTLEKMFLHRKYVLYGEDSINSSKFCSRSEKLIQWAEQNEHKGVVVSILLIMLYRKVNAKKLAYEICEKLAEKFCSCWLADVIYYGEGCKKDVEKSIKMLEDIIKRGETSEHKCLYAYYSLAYIYCSAGRYYDPGKVETLITQGYKLGSLWGIETVKQFNKEKFTQISISISDAREKGIQQYHRYIETLASKSVILKEVTPITPVEVKESKEQLKIELLTKENIEQKEKLMKAMEQNEELMKKLEQLEKEKNDKMKKEEELAKLKKEEELAKLKKEEELSKLKKEEEEEDYEKIELEDNK